MNIFFFLSFFSKISFQSPKRRWDLLSCSGATYPARMTISTYCARLMLSSPQLSTNSLEWQCKSFLFLLCGKAGSNQCYHVCLLTVNFKSYIKIQRSEGMRWAVTLSRQDYTFWWLLRISMALLSSPPSPTQSHKGMRATLSNVFSQETKLNFLLWGYEGIHNFYYRFLLLGILYRFYNSHKYYLPRETKSWIYYGFGKN